MQYYLGVFGVLDLDPMENQPLKLIDGGIERRFREKYDYENDKRPGYHGYLFQYTLQGAGKFCKDGQCHRVSEGMGFLVHFPEHSRYYLSADSGERWEFVYLHFDGAAAAPFAERLEMLGGSPFVLGKESLPVRMALQMQRERLEGKRLEQYEGGEFLYRFLCALLREVEHPSSGQGNSWVKNAAAMMEADFGTLSGVEEVAVRIGVSPAHFARVFQKETGVSPIQYLTRLRLQFAINDLLNTPDTLEVIARRNGFSSGNYFCKVFRKHLNCSPTEYRNQRKG